VGATRKKKKSTPWSSKWSLPFRPCDYNFVRISDSPHACYMRSTFRLHWLCCRNHMWRRKQIIMSCSHNMLLLCRDSSVGIAAGYRLDARRIGSRFPAGPRDFSLLHSVQTGTWVPGGGVKRQGHEADSSPSSSADVKNAWSHDSTLHTSSWCFA
jgi:hypothetical protein